VSSLHAFQPKVYKHFSFSLCELRAQPIPSSFSDHYTICGEEYKLRSFSLCNCGHTLTVLRDINRYFHKAQCRLIQPGCLITRVFNLPNYSTRFNETSLSLQQIYTNISCKFYFCPFPSNTTANSHEVEIKFLRNILHKNAHIKLRSETLFDIAYV
jgi:hypothetical protein